MSTDGKDTNWPHRPQLPIPSADARDRAAYEAAQITRFLESQRGKPPYRAAPPASRAIGKVVRPLSKKFGPGLSEITKHWPQIVGKRFAGICQPLKMQGGRDGRVLVIGAKGPAVALISASSAQILERLNHYSETPVARIKVQQSVMSAPKADTPRKAALPGLSPSEDKALQSGLEPVRDDTLRQALEGLGRKVTAKTKSQ